MLQPFLGRLNFYGSEPSQLIFVSDEEITNPDRYDVLMYLMIQRKLNGQLFIKILKI